MKNILVAIDFKGDEQLLIDTASKFAKVFHSKIWIIHIAAPNPDFVGYESGPQYIRDNRATQLKKEHKLLQSLSNELKDKGIESDGLLVEGATIEMIIEESEKLHIDLIIVGHSDHNFIYKSLFGNVSKGIIKKSKIPVLSVPLE